MSDGIIRIDDDGLSNQIHRHVMASDLVRHDAEEVQRVSMLRLHRKDLPVERLGFRQPPRLMVLKPHLKRLWNRHIIRARGIACYTTPATWTDMRLPHSAQTAARP
jgi:hypothetical protein